MKNIKKFQNIEAYNYYMNTDDAVSPNVSKCSDNILIYRKQQDIPVRYIPIEYIEATGSQYIFTTDMYDEYDPTADRGYWNINSQYKIQVKYYVPNSEQVSQAALLALGEDYSPTLYCNNANGMYWKFPQVSTEYFQTVKPASLNQRQAKISNYNEIAEAEIIYKCIANKQDYLPWMYCIFARPVMPIENTDRKIKAKLYYLKIWRDDELLHDMIPCKTLNGEPGLYDNVNNYFFKSSTDTAFIAGPEI